MITRTNLRIRAARGLAWIKEHGAEYDLDVDRVVIDRLVMNSQHACVLGQAFHGQFDRIGESRFGVVAGKIEDENPRRNIDFWLQQHGFDLKSEVEDTSGAWEQLRDAWAEILQQDREATQP
jgi:hypothetical protein